VPLLVYCISESEVPPPPSGVRNQRVEHEAIAGMQCYFSVFPAPLSKLTKDDALGFHHVITAIFSRTAVIPFRFPTILEGKGELEVYLETEGHDLLETLQRLREFVQMEVRLTVGDARAASAGSGKEYLESRKHASEDLLDLAESVHELLEEDVRGWHIHEFQNGVRCYALVPRHTVADFRHKCERLKLEGGVKAAVSGPWPPSEFMHESPESEA
jgi:Gas vesicle synthesis protein GvpL/GvpF